MPPPSRYLTEEEKKAAPKVTRALLSRIFAYLRPYLWQFALVFIAILLSAGIGLLPSIITGRIVDEALIGKDMRLLIQLLLAAFVTLTLSQVISVLESYINAWIAQRIVYDMKNEMYRHLQDMPHAFFTTEKQGDVITRMESDISGVASVVSNTLTNIVSNVAILVTTLIALFSMSWQLAIVGIIVIPLLIIPSRSVGETRWKLLTESRAKQDELNQIINETLSVSGSLLVKLFSKEDYEYSRFAAVNKEVMQISLKEQRSGKWFRMMMGMFTQVAPLLIYFAGGWFIIESVNPTLSVGTVTATVALINRLYRPVEQLLNINVDFTRSLALFNRIFEYLDREITISSPRITKHPAVNTGHIEFSHVAFSYTPEVPIIRDVSFTVPPGQMYAIVGPSGSGKSTLVNLLPRLYDVTAGCVKLNYTDVRQYDLDLLRKQIGMVSQETYLFNGTIRENLQYANPNVTQAAMEDACKMANIHDSIISWPNGYDTVVGNRGLKLSGGEKQRLSIARVMLKNPRVLVLDEATSALDSISEQAIQSAIEKLMVGRTSLVIAHRLSTILAANRILVLKDGVIAEEGTHDELLERNGVYRELYETQFRLVLEREEAKK
ncbi:MAG: ABC transporter ATP-binding protein [Eubacteriales bacterium]|nr:ABC transporter ATP-binding protein [Eubacteriales bacterium]